MNVIPSAGAFAAPAVRSSATIDIRIQRIDQLLDSLDPSPFRRLARIPVDFEFDLTEHGQSKTRARS